jgi:hypothetical protein
LKEDQEQLARENRMRLQVQKIPVTLKIPVWKWQTLQKMARELKVESLTFFEEPLSYGCCVCPLDGKKCEAEKKRYAMRNDNNSTAMFDCFGALMRWLLWEDGEDEGISER